MVGVCVPKTIPHLLFAPMVHNNTEAHYLRLASTKMYIKSYFKETANQFK
jgi:hypothetical protein